MERLITEQLFHDQQAGERSRTFRLFPETLRIVEQDYLNHESWIRAAFDELGNLKDLRVLDYGCGHGMAAVVLAQRGARVTACDLSPGYLHEAKQRAAANEMHVDFLQADGERLPFADQSFDRIWGNAILHHLDLSIAARELFRILKPGGVGVFCEPWGGNPLLNWARNRLPYPGKSRTPEERPLNTADVVTIRQIFPRVCIRGFQFLSMLHPSSPASVRDSCCS